VLRFVVARQRIVAAFGSENGEPERDSGIFQAIAPRSMLKPSRGWWTPLLDYKVDSPQY